MAEEARKAHEHTTAVIIDIAIIIVLIDANPAYAKVISGAVMCVLDVLRLGSMTEGGPQDPIPSLKSAVGYRYNPRIDPVWFSQVLPNDRGNNKPSTCRVIFQAENLGYRCFPWKYNGREGVAST